MELFIGLLPPEKKKGLLKPVSIGVWKNAKICASIRIAIIK